MAPVKHEKAERDESLAGGAFGESCRVPMTPSLKLCTNLSGQHDVLTLKLL